MSGSNKYKIIYIYICLRLAADESSLKGSYRSKSEFNETKKDAGPVSSAPQEDRGGEGDSLYSSSSFKSSCNSLTWDTLKKIRRQKSRRHTNELKKYQSTVCIYGEDKFTSLQDEAPPRGLKYEDVYRSSPSLCEDRGLAATRHLSASRLKFTGEEPQEQSHYPGATAKFLFLNVWSDVYFSHDIFKFQIGVSKVP